MDGFLHGQTRQQQPSRISSRSASCLGRVCLCLLHTVVHITQHYTSHVLSGCLSASYLHVLGLLLAGSPWVSVQPKPTPKLKPKPPLLF